MAEAGAYPADLGPREVCTVSNAFGESRLSPIRGRSYVRASVARKAIYAYGKRYQNRLRHRGSTHS